MKMRKLSKLLLDNKDEIRFDYLNTAKTIISQIYYYKNEVAEKKY